MVCHVTVILPLPKLIALKLFIKVYLFHYTTCIGFFAIHMSCASLVEHYCCMHAPTSTICICIQPYVLRTVHMTICNPKVYTEK